MPFDCIEYDVGSGGRYPWEQPRAPQLPATPVKGNIWAPRSDVRVTDTRTIRQLNSLRLRQVNWDGYGATAPRGETIEIAKALYWKLPHCRLPDVHCAGDGEITMVWDNKTEYLELGVDADGGISFYGRAEGEPPVLGDLDDIPDSLPDSLLSFLSRFKNGRVRVRA